MNDNETVEQLCELMRRAALVQTADDPRAVIAYADRILAAHNREKCEWAASLTKQRSINKELVEENNKIRLQAYNYTQAVAKVFMAKDEEIESLSVTIGFLSSSRRGRF